MRIPSICVALGLLGLSTVASPALAACQLTPIAELPVTMHGLRPTVSAKVNGQDARFVVNTGAYFSLLGPLSAARFGLKPGPTPPGVVVRGVGGEVDAGFATAKDFELMGMRFHNADFFVGEHQFGADDGLLGSNVFSQADAEYDFANGVIRFFKEQGCSGASLAYWANGAGVGELSLDKINLRPTGPGEQAQFKIKGPATLNGARIRVEFDSGALRSVLTLRAARRAGVKTDSPDVVRAGVGSGVDRRLIPDWIAPFQSFDIGGEQVKSTHLRVSDINDDEADMLLGADFFLSHRIFISADQSKAFFTYNGGPVFDLGVAPPTLPASAAPAGAPATSSSSAAAAAPTIPTPGAAAAADPNQPTDAAGFLRRGAAYLARREVDPAIADYSQAIALAPSDPQPYVQRAAAFVLNRQPFKALDDLNQALKLKPDAAPALMLRGQLRLAGKDVTGAKADFEAAAKSDPSMRARVAGAYERAGLFEDALGEFDTWIASQPKGEDLAAPLAGRCRARGFLNRDLDKALADCDAALKLVPGAPAALGSRGLVELRLGQADPAIADFDAVLKVDPRDAWALYGRGLAKLKKGDKPGSDADLAAATAIQPTVAQQAKTVGLAS